MSYRKFAYVYDRLMADMPYSEWLRFAGYCWSKYGAPETVVDLGCGTGSIAIPLAQSGLNVTGIDRSEDMLAVARQKTDELRRTSPFPSGGSVTWLLQDMREWELPQPVDCVISFCDCLNYLLEEDDVIRTFSQVHRGLNEAGLFIFDVHTPYLLQRYAEEQPFMLNEDDIAYIWTCELDERRCQIEHQLTIFAVLDGADAGIGGGEARRPGAGEKWYRRIEETHVQRAYPLDWLESRLKETGFSEVRSYADFSWRPPAEHTERAFLVARK